MSAAVVRAGQLVFARVEPAYSPTARAGYQVVWASRSLPSQLVDEIAVRVRCFTASPGRERRLQFAPLPAGGFFASCTRQLPANPQVSDRDGRSTFLANAVWLDNKEFEAVDSDPFALLAALPAGGIEDLVASFGQASGAAPELDVAVGEGATATAAADGNLAAGWDSSLADLDPSLLPLVGGVLADGGGAARPPIFLRGSSEQLEVVLRTVVALLPPSSRGRCSFDTVVDGCPPRADYRFVAGAWRPPAQRVEVVDLGAERSAAVVGPPAASYVAWLARALASRPLAAVKTQTETAYWACLALCGEQAAAAADGVALDPGVCREILAHEGEQLGRRVLAWSRRGIRLGGRERCCQWLLGELLEAAPERLVAGLLRPFPPPVRGG